MCILVFVTTRGQGVFFGSNAAGRTRVGSIDGPLAGTNIFGQFFSGATSDSLTPIDMASPHFQNGVFALGNVTVPNRSKNRPRQLHAAAVRQAGHRARPF